MGRRCRLNGVGPRARLDVLGGKKSLAPTGIRFPDRPVSSLLPTTGPLNPSVAGNTLTTTQCSAARGDIWNEKSLLILSLPQPRYKAEALFVKLWAIYLWWHRITSSFGTNVVQIATPFFMLQISFFVIFSSYYYHYNFTAHYALTQSIIHTHIHAQFCVLNSLLPARRTLFFSDCSHHMKGAAGFPCLWLATSTSNINTYRAAPQQTEAYNNNNNNNNNNWYEHVPKSVETSQGGKVTILWNQQVQTDRTIPNSKPDITIRDNEKGTCMLLDVAISGDRNVIKKKPRKF